MKQEIDKIMKSIGHPVMIGDVLEAIKKQFVADSDIDTPDYDLLHSDIFKLIELWGLCNFTTSLGTLFYRGDWQKDKATRELFEFIETLNLF